MISAAEFERSLNVIISAYKEGISIIDKDHKVYNIDIDLISPDFKDYKKEFRLFDEDLDYRIGDVLKHKDSEHIIQIRKVLPSGNSFLVTDLTYIMEMVKDQSKVYRKHNMVQRTDTEFLFYEA